MLGAFEQQGRLHFNTFVKTGVSNYSNIRSKAPRSFNVPLFMSKNTAILGNITKELRFNQIRFQAC